MDEFADIAPYPDSELRQRLVALCKDQELLDAALAIRFQTKSKVLAHLIRPLVRGLVKKEVGSILDRSSWHDLLVRYIELILKNTSDGFTHSGVESVPRSEPCVFISNHRDIALDPVLVNYALWLNDVPTCKIAFGDNLLEMRLGAEFMRINDSFIVVRNVQGLKAQFAALNKTSRYIRHVLAQRQGVWIAQREGRSKDGIDKTDPAVLKMLALAYRAQSKDMSYMLEQVNLIPTTFTYELDPCAPRKAMELAERERTGGAYTKAMHEDRDSLVQGITGFKGRIHLAFAAPMQPIYGDADALAEAIDRTMVRNRKPFPTFKAAKELLDGKTTKILDGKVHDEFTSQWQSLKDDEQKLLLYQYANQFVETSNS